MAENLHGPTTPEDHHLSRSSACATWFSHKCSRSWAARGLDSLPDSAARKPFVWLFAFAVFYAPMAVAVYYLNRELPLEGGLYVWARRAFGDTAGFLVAWNIWAYGLFVIAFLLLPDFQRILLHDRSGSRLDS